MTEKTILRARRDADVAALHEGLYEQVRTRAAADTRAWVPRTPGDSPYAVIPSDESVAFFSIEERATGRLAGACELWGVDLFHRSAHIGVAILPEFRRRGLATDAVESLCRYAFDVRGLHRLGLETLAENTGMVEVATRAGFKPEGCRRAALWVYGEWRDEVSFGLLAGEWRAGG